MQLSSSFPRSALIVSLALGLAACGRQSPSIPVGTEASNATMHVQSSSYQLYKPIPNLALGFAATDGAGNLYASGRILKDINGNACSVNCGVLVKFDPDGLRLWQHANGDIEIRKLAVDAKGTVSAIGFNYPDSYLLQFDTSGNKIRSERAGVYDFMDLAVDFQGNVYTVSGQAGQYPVSITKRTTAYQKVWTQQVSGKADCGNPSLGVNKFGTTAYPYVVCSGDSASQTVTLIGFGADGQRRITKSFPGGLFTDVAVSPYGSSYTLRNSDVEPQYDMLTKYTAGGSWQWAKNVASASPTQYETKSASVVDVDMSSDVYVGGYTRDNQAKLIKLDADTGNVIWNGRIDCSPCSTRDVAVSPLGSVWAVGSKADGGFIARFAQK
ncbi:hypothetical protein [Deinococcus peraridilitoris]|uniref:PQQ enzyme repeat-containing protein n=1 Tax=Deinococcus peraridilitoris (strain DSM 19664 / LMG 22246 / CIP 109416 / KR-200) TaxID=937777 RepID=L0A4I1_DEIPD|nr:hypothetical protein [Deinococcus peraridilitoris]AFZ68339.1 hypothetical protein Deipe_2876 [Deinococcus peraridilitoris DSM 19664]